jgi:hypothetical protein
MSESLTFVRTREREREGEIFNVDNVLLHVIYQLNFTVFMHVTRISHYMTLHTAFGIIHGFP